MTTDALPVAHLDAGTPSSDRSSLATAYIAAVIAAGLLLIASQWPRELVHPRVLALLLTTSFVLSLFKLRLPLPSGHATMSMAYTVDFAALLLCGPDAAILVATIGVLVQCGVGNTKKQPWVRTVFSVAAVAIAVQAAGVAWLALGGNIEELGLLTTIGPMSAAAVVYFLVNTIAVALAIALTTGTSPKAAWNGDFLWIAPSYFFSAAIGAMVAIIISHGAYALLLLAFAPLYISHRAYRASVDRIEAERCHARELSTMVATTQEALCRATNSETALVAEKERLALERTRLATTLQTITEAVVTVDSAGCVLLINDSAEALIGVSAATAVERPVTYFLTVLGLETADYAGAMQLVLDAGEPARLRCELTAPEARVVEITGTPMRTGQDRVAGAVWVLRDVTDEARVEQERSKTARLESLGVLAGGLAHDFNNILMGVVGNLSMAEALVPQQDLPLAQRLREAEAACVRARGVTSQLLTFAKGGAPVKTTASIHELVTECARFALSGSPVAARFFADDDLWSAEIDTVQVSQVVHNLVLNAMQAMPRGGTVDILMRNVRVDAASANAPAGLRSGRFVCLSVLDQGPGISAEHLSRIFEPYFTTKEKGSGLGLAISSSIVRAHGGAMLVESTPANPGTRFDVYLPASMGKVLALPPVAITSGEGSTGRVLLMDDDAMVSEVAQDMLGILGYACDTAPCGQSALDRLKAAETNGQPYDLMILDLTVPGGMGGKEAVPHVRQVRPDMPVLVMSGYADNTVLAEHARHGFDGVLPKPFTIPDLRVALEQACARRSAKKWTAHARVS